MSELERCPISFFLGMATASAVILAATGVICRRGPIGGGGEQP